MFCPACGAENSEQNTYCHQCGLSLSTVSRQVELLRLLEHFAKSVENVSLSLFFKGKNYPLPDRETLRRFYREGLIEGDDLVFFHEKKSWFEVKRLLSEEENDLAEGQAISLRTNPFDNRKTLEMGKDVKVPRKPRRLTLKEEELNFSKRKTPAPMTVEFAQPQPEPHEETPTAAEGTLPALVSEEHFDLEEDDTDSFYDDSEDETLVIGQSLDPSMFGNDNLATIDDLQRSGLLEPPAPSISLAKQASHAPLPTGEQIAFEESDASPSSDPFIPKKTPAPKDSPHTLVDFEFPVLDKSDELGDFFDIDEEEGASERTKQFSQEGELLLQRSDDLLGRSISLYEEENEDDLSEHTLNISPIQMKELEKEEGSERIAEDSSLHYSTNLPDTPSPFVPMTTPSLKDKRSTEEHLKEQKEKASSSKPSGGLFRRLHCVQIVEDLLVIGESYCCLVDGRRRVRLSDASGNLSIVRELDAPVEQMLGMGEELFLLQPKKSRLLIFSLPMLIPRHEYVFESQPSAMILVEKGKMLVALPERGELLLLDWGDKKISSRTILTGGTPYRFIESKESFLILHRDEHYVTELNKLDFLHSSIR